MKKILLGSLSLIFLALIIMVFTPVPRPTPQNCKRISGVVEAVFTPCCQDVVLKLKNDPHRYYINRGLDHNEIDLDEFSALLVGQKVAFQVIKRNWTPLDPKHLLQPVAQVERRGEVVFTRIV